MATDKDFLAAMTKERDIYQARCNGWEAKYATLDGKHNQAVADIAAKVQVITEKESLIATMMARISSVDNDLWAAQATVAEFLKESVTARKLRLQKEKDDAIALKKMAEEKAAEVDKALSELSNHSG